MVKKMLVVVSALALMLGTVGLASAFLPGVGMTGEMIMIPMKVKTTFEKSTGPAGASTLMLDGCSQYTSGFWPAGPWAGTQCVMKVQVIPPKCVAPGYMGPVQLGAPPALPPGSQLVSNVESYQVTSPGCNPCVEGGLKYEMVKKQVVK
ncbi:MAG: hypothetical protein AB1664_14930 [Thermodesulfobacteriota bacterium]